jgi:predicted nucleic acid-binding protein
MKVYVLDASALIRYLSNGSGEEKVHALLQRAAKSEVRVLISVINWGEALYSLAKVAGLGNAAADLKAMGAFVESVAADETLAKAAAIVRLHYKLGYADWFAAALAMGMDATLVSSDPDFAKLGKNLKVLALPRHSG